ncbi:MAG: preprotein translocase subunit SecG [Rhodospirillales bacterium]
MTTVILVLHLILAIAMVGTILLQRSEGGGLGIGGGGGGGMGGFLSGRSTANLLTRTTAILAMCFFVTSLVLAILAGDRKPASSILDQSPPAASQPAAPKDQTPSAPLAK